MKVSFDFDGTLEHEHVQKYARELIHEGVEVWVVTTRYDENHKHRYPENATLDDLWAVVDDLEIPRHRVRFTCMEWKGKYLAGTSFIWHLDDNNEEFTQARQYQCKVPMIHVEGGSWKNKCNRLIQNWIDTHQRLTPND